MKNLFSICLILFLGFPNCYSQETRENDFIQLETNKVLCLFSFLETVADSPSASFSFRDYIFEALDGEEAFMDLVDRYKRINMSHHIEKNEYPDKRKKYPMVKDLIWVATSNASSLDDLSERIIGYLPNSDHVELIEIMKEVELYYDGLIWNQKQDEIARIEKQIAPFLVKIENLFFKISKLYGTDWKQEIPFKIELYPIPLKRGSTTAIPKGNTLICSFLTEREDDYLGRLGVIIHEMCHIIYDEQPIDFQHEIDSWLKQTESEYNKLAYTYLNEGLATAIGNGWAYRELNGEVDTSQWYNDNYINGFGHALFPLVDEYLAENKTMDEDFFSEAVDLFGEEFPSSLQDPGVLLNAVKMFAIPESEEGASALLNVMRPYFRISSLWLSTPISDPASIEAFHDSDITKFFIVDQDHEATYDLLSKHFDHMDDLEPSKEFIFAFHHKDSNSPVIILNVQGEDRFEDGLQVLKAQKVLPFDEVIEVPTKK